MKTYTNHTQGMRGIREDDGSEAGVIHFLAPGASVKLAKVKEPIPDLGKAPEKDDAEDTALIDAVQAENADLKKQVEGLQAENEALKAELAKFDKPGGSKPKA